MTNNHLIIKESLNNFIMCNTVMLKSECELFKMFNFIHFKCRFKPKHQTQRRGSDFCFQCMEAVRLADQGDESRLRSRWKMTRDTIGLASVSSEEKHLFFEYVSCNILKDIFSYLHAMFNLATNLPLLLTSAALIPWLKKIEKSISWTFVEVDMSKNKFK